MCRVFSWATSVFDQVCSVDSLKIMSVVSSEDSGLDEKIFMSCSLVLLWSECSASSAVNLERCPWLVFFFSRFPCNDRTLVSFFFVAFLVCFGLFLSVSVSIVAFAFLYRHTDTVYLCCLLVILHFATFYICNCTKIIIITMLSIRCTFIVKYKYKIAFQPVHPLYHCYCWVLRMSPQTVNRRNFKQISTR